MRTHSFQLAIAGFVFLAINASATTRYVDLNSTNAMPPYTDWGTAAVTIQDAVDAANNGDTVLVTNGVYQTGGQVVDGAMMNRVAVTKAVTVQSVNGPEVTVIEGYQVPDTINDDGSVRCVYLANGATLIGFTLANGATLSWGDLDYELSGGGVWCESASAVVSNCVLSGNSAFNNGGGAYQGTLKHCVLADNWAGNYGGGVFNGALTNCLLMGSSAFYGGAAYGGTLNYCALTNNSAACGGGAYQGTLTNCALADNTAWGGGGAYLSALNNCLLIGNSADEYGGGVYGGSLINCTLAGNWAGDYNSGGGGEDSIENYYQGDGGNTGYGGGAYGGMFKNCTFCTNSASYGGGAYYATLNNCTLTGNSANYYGGGTYYGTLNNCALTDNSAFYGGGAYYGTFTNCTLIENYAWYGGGIYGGILTNCTFTGNSADDCGGGAYSSELYNCTLNNNSSTQGGGTGYGTLTACTLTGNYANYGAGAYYDTLTGCTFAGNYGTDGAGSYGCTLYNCTLTGNSAENDGGGAYQGTLCNCILAGNSAYDGGGEYYATMYNCTLTGNSAEDSGGGAYQGTLYNCIVYFNSAPNGANYNNLVPSLMNSGGTSFMNYCCTTPLPDGGVGNISDNPRLASLSHISSLSPCRAAGSASYTYGVDIDGEAWANPPSIGCDEYHAGSVTGPLTVAIQATYVLLATGIEDDFTALIGGRVSGSQWEFDDGTVVSNQPYASRTWTVPGDYPVVLRAFNESYPTGVIARVIVQVRVQPLHYVALSSSNPVAPYGSWATAATNIQDAVDVASPNALILVSNGVYITGSRMIWGAPARVVVTKAVTVQSVNGPAATAIDGAGLMSCAYLTNGVLMTGFTLTNGAFGEGAGGGVWCDSAGAVVSNCVLTGNSANYGGGAYQGTLNNCTLTGNSAYYGGGGTYYSVLTNCMLTGNTAEYGGGTFDSTLNNCQIKSNSASYYGGGAYYGTLNNCAVFGNSADEGGGAYQSTLNNCTLTGNSADDSGGGVFLGILNNCIVYYNIASSGSNYYYDTNLNYCCTTPLPTNGTANISDDPQLASLSHISAISPCRGAGNVTNATGVDIDGEAWADPPSIGCDEYISGSVTGALTVAIRATYTLLATGIEDDFTALIDGRVSASQWEFDDGTVVSNQPYASRTWTEPGDYPVVLRAYNETYPTGVIATVIVRVMVQPVHYVALSSTNPVAPYGSWATAATNIQDAVDVASPNALILVSNGVYNIGSRVQEGWTVRVAATKPLGVQSVNGPAVTAIDGGSAMNCIYLTNGAVLTGFTLTNGSTGGNGGGVWCESASAVVSNCVLTGNSAWDGGGAYQGTLNNCTLTGNSASYQGGGACYCIFSNCTLTNNYSEWEGGGAYQGTLTNCTLTGNSAYYGGGVNSGALNNCLLTGNSANYYGGGACYSTLNNCTVVSNWVPENYQFEGGGAASCTLNNCMVTGNSAGYGGGACDSTLNNCTVTGNSADYGGGVCWNTLNNCIIYYNTALAGGSNYLSSTLNYCCTMPLPSESEGCITNEPLFIDLAGGNLRLQTNSPCIDAGTNLYVVGNTDLDGTPRIVNDIVDMGAYEYHTNSLSPFRLWLQSYGLPTDGSADYTDPDGDHMNNWQEWVAGTNPTNALSVLQMLTVSNSVSGVTVTWLSVTNRTYFLDRSTNLLALPAFHTIATDIPGQPDTTIYTDTNATGEGPYFYRVGVDE